MQVNLPDFEGFCRLGPALLTRRFSASACRNSEKVMFWTFRFWFPLELDDGDRYGRTDQRFDQAGHLCGVVPVELALHAAKGDTGAKKACQGSFVSGL